MKAADEVLYAAKEADKSQIYPAQKEPQKG
jgi:hypothetical protein